MKQRCTSLMMTWLMLGVILSAMPFASAVDGDGDGADDAVDDCPFAWGNSTVDRQGCPDSDGDGTSDIVQGETGNWEGAGVIAYHNIGGGDSRTVVAAPNGQFIAGGSDGDIELYDNVGRFIVDIADLGTTVRRLSISPNGTLLAAAGSESSSVAVLTVYELDWTQQTATELIQLGSNHVGDTDGAAFSSDGSMFIAGGEDWNLTIYNTTTWQVISSIETEDAVNNLALSPDGRLVAAVHGQEMTVFWTGNGSTLYNVHNHSGSANAVDWSADGLHIITGGSDSRWFLYYAENGTTKASNWWGSSVYNIRFHPDGQHVVFASRRTSSNVYDIRGAWTDKGNFGDWNQQGSQNDGIYDATFSSSGDLMFVGTRSGYTISYGSGNAWVQIGGDIVNEHMNSRWRTTHDGADGRMPWGMNATVHDMSTALCWDVNPDYETFMLGASSGASRSLVTAAANHSETGMVECDQSGDALIEVPVGRMAAGLVVQAGGEAASCIQSMGGLSIAQFRWMISGASDSDLTNSDWAPDMDLSSVAPEDDQDGLREWSDLGQGCPSEAVHIRHRWENRSVPQMIVGSFLCTHCTFGEDWFGDTTSRYRFKVELRSTIIEGSVGNDHVLGITEMKVVENTGANVYKIPIVDNWTHGAADAIAAGGVAVAPNTADAENGTYALSGDFRVTTREDHLTRTAPIISSLLGEEAQSEWDDFGFVRLDVFSRVQSWDRIGMDMRSILPDDDGDGIWNGEDDCPATPVSAVVDANGCADTQLDDDEDGVNNALDDCPDVAGTSTAGLVGCVDGDGDGWADSEDTFPTNGEQWADGDGDGFGDNTGQLDGDDCPETHGTSHQDRNGCPDLDGDGWSDENDVFPSDGSQWADTDEDGVGDNHSWESIVDGLRVNEVGDAFPSDPSQHKDRDGDGYGDNPTGFQADDCPDVAGTANQPGRLGCLDSDGDGFDDENDDFPNDGTQWADADGDGYGDSMGGTSPDLCFATPLEEIGDVDENGCGPSERDGDIDGVSDADDLCPTTPLADATSVDSNGCASNERDSDGDGVMDSDDHWPDDANQSADSDGDGWGDDSNVPGGDACPNTVGTSTVDRLGCPDSDGDGTSDENDAVPSDASQWADSDGDGFYDNFADLSWRSDTMRTEADPAWPGAYTPGALRPDRCPLHASEFGGVNPGCPADMDPDGAQQTVDPPVTEPPASSGGSGNGLIWAGLAALIVIIIGGAVAAVLILGKKEAAPKPEPSMLEPEAAAEPVEAESQEDDGVSVDEHGTEWWQDDVGVWWYRTPEMTDWAEFQN